MAVNKPLEVVEEPKKKTLTDEEFVQDQLKNGEKIESVMSLGNIINATVVDSNGQSSIRKFTRD